MNFPFHVDGVNYLCDSVCASFYDPDDAHFDFIRERCLQCPHAKCLDPVGGDCDEQ